MVTAPKPDFYQTVHDGPIQTIQRSPFFKDVLLCVGGWNFTLWKEGVNVRIIQLSFINTSSLFD